MLSSGIGANLFSAGVVTKAAIQYIIGFIVNNNRTLICNMKNLCLLDTCQHEAIFAILKMTNDFYLVSYLNRNKNYSSGSNTH